MGKNVKSLRKFRKGTLSQEICQKLNENVYLIFQSSQCEIYIIYTIADEAYNCKQSTYLNKNCMQKTDTD